MFQIIFLSIEILQNRNFVIPVKNIRKNSIVIYFIQDC